MTLFALTDAETAHDVARLRALEHALAHHDYRTALVLAGCAHNVTEAERERAERLIEEVLA